MCKRMGWITEKTQGFSGVKGLRYDNRTPGVEDRIRKDIQARNMKQGQHRQVLGFRGDQGRAAYIDCVIEHHAMGDHRAFG